MRKYSVGHVSDSALLRDALAYAVGERSNLVQLLVCIAEIDQRKLYLPAGYPSMSAYCVGEFRLTEDEAWKRLHVARTAREFPVLFDELDEGSLCLSRVRMLATHLTLENVEELVGAAKGTRSLAEFRLFLDRFAKPGLLNSAPQTVDDSQARGPVTEPVVSVPQPIESGAANDVANLQARGPVTPPVEDEEWVELRVKVRREKLQHAKELLSHSVPSGNAIWILDRALDALIARLEKRKYAACKKPRATRPRAMERNRGIPADVRRAVWERDGGQCTFPGDGGRRCGTRRLLEFDHIVPVARGGKSTIENLRLRCRGHNQYTAEQDFGVEFMQQKREQARVRPAMPVPPGHRFRDRVIARLRALGVSQTEACLVLERSGALEKTTLEESMRAALQCLGPRRRPPS